jgi:drug/metabolite transporter (DMT)-like permease
MNYIFFAGTAAVAFAISQVLNKLLSKHSIDNKDSLMAYFMVATFTFGLTLIPFVPLTLPSWEVLQLLMFAAATFLIGYYFFFRGIFTTDASSVAPLFQTQAALVALLAFLFLGERFPLQNYLWMILLGIGAILVSFDEKMSVKGFLRPGIALILLMQVFHALSNVVVGVALNQVSPLTFLFWENMIIGLAAIVFILFKKPKMNYSLNQIIPMFISSFVVGIGILSLFRAFAENLTISSVVGLLSAPLVFVISLIASRFSPTFLEHHTSKVYFVRGLGLIIILVGAYQIVVQ